MTPLVLVILAVMWVLVLVPPLLRSRTDGRPNHSISSFQRQLRTLQRTGHPTRGTVTYLRTPPPPAPRRPFGYAYSAEVASQRADAATGYEESHDAYSADYGMWPEGRGERRATPVRSRRYAATQREALRRRQTVLLWLIGVVFFSAVLAFGMGLSSLVWVFFACLGALVLYVLALIHLRRAAELRAARLGRSRMAA